MVEQRRGLGRGLSALLDEAGAGVVAGDAPVAGVQATPIEQIRRNPDQPRQDFGEIELNELAESIRQHGLIQPILVRSMPGGAPGEYQIVAGERRWRAAQLAGMHQVPVVIREVDDLAAIEIAVIENVQRVDLNIIEEALGYKTLIERFGRTQEAVAQTVGKSRSHVANALRLLALPAQVQTDLRAGKLSPGHARAIAAAPDPASLARQVLDHGLNVRETEALARRAQDGARPGAPSRSTGRGRSADIDALEVDLSEALGLKVELDDRGGAGEIRIRYRTLEQLDALCQRLTRSGPL